MLYLVLLALLSGCVAKLVDGYAKLSAQDTEQYSAQKMFSNSQQVRAATTAVD